MIGRHLFRVGALIVIAQAIVAFVGVLSLRFYTNLVSPDVFGETNLLLSGLALGLQVFVAGIVAAQLRFYSQAEARGAADPFARETMRWALRSTSMLVALAILVLILLRWTGRFVYPIAAMVGGAAWLFAMTIRNVLMSRIQAQRRQALYAALQVIESLLIFSGTLMALHIAPTVTSFLLGQVVAIAFFLLMLFCLYPQARGAFVQSAPADTGFGARIWSYGAPFVPMSIMGWFANLGDRYTLASMLGSNSTGRYVAPFSIASRGMMLANAALCDLFRPSLFDAENRCDDHHANATFTRWLCSSVALSSTGLATVYFAGPLIVGLLLAPNYRSGAVMIMIWVSIGYAVSGVTQIVENRLLSLGHSGRLLMPMVLGAAANVIFSVVLIRSNGIVGAAQATFASFVVQNVATVGILLHAFSLRNARRARENTIEPA